MSDGSAAKEGDAPAAPKTPRAEVLHLPRRPQELVQAPRPEVTVLVADADGVSRRFVELTLGRETGWQVESAKDGASALEILNSTLADVLICEKELPDMTGLELHERLKQQRRLLHIPLVFFTSDTKVATRVLAYRMGVDDFVLKPCDGAELVARVSAQVRKARRVRAASRGRSYTLAGELAVMELPDLVTTLAMQRRTGSLALSTPRSVGEVFFENGRVVHALFGSLVGPHAFYRMMRETQGQFEFTLGPCNLTEAERTITESVTGLIMEGARLADTDKLLAEGLQLPVDPVEEVAARPAEPRWAYEEHPPTTAAAQFELGLKDRFKLGELRVMDHEAILWWTRQPGGKERLHVHVYSELARGVSAFMGLASPQTEREILAALAPSPKALLLSFFLRNDRLVDMLLLDISAPQQFIKALGRVPTLTVLAPPDGDFLSVSTTGRVELDDALRQLPPRALLGVGNASLSGHVSSLSCMRHAPTPRAFVQGSLGDDGSDLRELLLQGIRLWATS